MKHDRITVRINSEIRDMLNKQNNESEPESLLIRRAITLGLDMLALAEELHLPYPKPKKLMNWIQKSLVKTEKGDKTIDFIKLLAKGDTPSNAEVVLLANALNIDVIILTSIRDSAVKTIRDNRRQRETSGSVQNEYIRDA